MARIATRQITGLLEGLALSGGPNGLRHAETLSRWLTRATRGRVRSTPREDGLYVEPRHCRTADGLRLTGWMVAPSGPSATVALFHDVRGHRAQMLPRIALLCAAGYRCVAFDHRAHGESDGGRTSFGWHEQHDVQAVLDMVKQEWPGQRCAAWGLSMGAAALCFAAARVSGLGAVILESPYADLESAFFSRFSSPGAPSWVCCLSRGTIWVTEQRLGVPLARVAPVAHIGNLAPAPLLLLAGEVDPYLPPLARQRLLAACRGPHEFHLVRHAGRHDVLDQGGVVHCQRVLDFLERRLIQNAAHALRATSACPGGPA